jgi:hypothetical protein
VTCLASSIAHFNRPLTEEIPRSRKQRSNERERPRDRVPQPSAVDGAARTSTSNTAGAKRDTKVVEVVCAFCRLLAGRLARARRGICAAREDLVDRALKLVDAHSGARAGAGAATRWTYLYVPAILTEYPLVTRARRVGRRCRDGPQLLQRSGLRRCAGHGGMKLGAELVDAGLGQVQVRRQTGTRLALW